MVPHDGMEQQFSDLPAILIFVSQVDSPSGAAQRTIGCRRINVLPLIARKCELDQVVHQVVRKSRCPPIPALEPGTKTQQRHRM
jgi:hypothetical protein